MRNIHVLIAVLIVLTLAACAARVTAASKPSMVDQEIATLKEMEATYNRGIEINNKSYEILRSQRSDYEGARDYFNQGLSNEQIDAQRNWLKYRNKESGEKYFYSLTSQQYKVALLLDDMAKSQEEFEIKTKADRERLAEFKAAISRYAASIQQGIQNEARRDAAITDGILRLNEQTQRVTDGMMQRSRDLMLMRR